MNSDSPSKSKDPIQDPVSPSPDGDPRTRKFFDDAAELSRAVLTRIIENSTNQCPYLAFAIYGGLIDPLLRMEARTRAFLAINPSSEAKAIAEKTLPHQRARIMEALATAAQAGDNPDIAAPATDATIDIFLPLVSEPSTWKFEEPIGSGAKRAWNNPATSPEETAFWNDLIAGTMGVKYALLRLYLYQRLREGSRDDQKLVELDTMIRKNIDGVLTTPYGTKLNRRIIYKADREHLLISAEPMWDVLSNELIQNAVVFSPPNAEIRVTISVEGKNAALFVDDDGPGFAMSKDLALKPFVSSLSAAGQKGHHCRVGLGLPCLDLLAKRSGWKFELAEGKQGLRPLLMFPLS
jgi:hypothetical protein